MSGIGGVRSWLEDFLLNKDSYDENYVTNFIKVADLWKQCIKDFKSCKNIKQCNDTYTEYIDKVDNLREEMNSSFGNRNVPIGISDTLDYFEDAIGELEDKYLDKLINDSKEFKTVIPFDFEGHAEAIAEEWSAEYPRVRFYVDNDKMTVVGHYYEVLGFLEDNFHSDYVEEATDNGEFVL